MGATPALCVLQAGKPLLGCSVGAGFWGLPPGALSSTGIAGPAQVPVVTCAREGGREVLQLDGWLGVRCSHRKNKTATRLCSRQQDQPSRKPGHGGASWSHVFPQSSGLTHLRSWPRLQVPLPLSFPAAVPESLVLRWPLAVLDPSSLSGRDLPVSSECPSDGVAGPRGDTVSSPSGLSHCLCHKGLEHGC